METETRTATETDGTLRTPSYIVGIGASAGGLEAIERFFDNVPQDTGMAFVIVQHLSPDFKSMMDELLARHTKLPIHLVEDGMAVEADHVYLNSPKNEMIISGGRLLLSAQDRQQERTLPIDLFFRSLAQDCGPRAVAIVMSGGGSDGSRGILDIHEAGGLVIVQDVDSAQFDGMPRTAADSGVAQWVLAPQDMPGVLAEHAAGRTRRAQAQGGSAPEAEGRRRRRGSGVPDAPGGVRHRLHPLQAEHRDPSHRTPARACPLPGHRGVRPSSEVRTERARRPLPRSAHRGHPVLQGRAGLQGARGDRSFPSSCSASRGTLRCGCGSPAARPGKRRTPWRSCFRT